MGGDIGWIRGMARLGSDNAKTNAGCGRKLMKKRRAHLVTDVTLALAQDGVTMIPRMLMPYGDADITKRLYPD